MMSESQIANIGFKKIGKCCQISERAVFHNPEKMVIGNYCRIDDFTVISAPIELADYIHIGSHCSIVGKQKLTMQNYSGLSSHCAVFTSSDNYDGQYMTNPCIPEQVNGTQIRKTESAEIIIHTHTVVGCRCTILAGTEIGSGSAIYAHSLLNGYYEPRSIYAGTPAKFVKSRKNNIFELEKQWHDHTELSI